MGAWGVGWAELSVFKITRATHKLLCNDFSIIHMINSTSFSLQCIQLDSFSLNNFSIAKLLLHGIFQRISNCMTFVRGQSRET